MWICRQIFCFIAFLVLVTCAYRYKDFGQINYNLLLDIKRQNSELRHKLGKICIRFPMITVTFLIVILIMPGKNGKLGNLISGKMCDWRKILLHRIKKYIKNFEKLS